MRADTITLSLKTIYYKLGQAFHRLQKQNRSNRRGQKFSQDNIDSVVSKLFSIAVEGSTSSTLLIGKLYCLGLFAVPLLSLRMHLFPPANIVRVISCWTRVCGYLGGILPAAGLGGSVLLATSLKALVSAQTYYLDQKRAAGQPTRTNRALAPLTQGQRAIPTTPTTQISHSHFRRER